MTPTVAEYVVGRLASLGIEHVFGVPGDYSFPWNDAIDSSTELSWVGSANELNAAYAADGYARVRGIAALNTTYGVGELSALNGVMGAFAEHVPIIHLVGMPSVRGQRSRHIMHHFAGSGGYDRYVQAAALATCAHTQLTPHNAIAETERVLAAALHHRQPVYICGGQDLLRLPVVGEPVTRSWRDTGQLPSDPTALEEAAQRLEAKLATAQSVVILPSHLVARYGLQSHVEALLSATGFVFASTPMDKAVLTETHPQHVGMYQGAMSAPEVRAAVDGADVVLSLGTVFSDMNTGFWTSGINPANLVEIGVDSVTFHDRGGLETITPVMMTDVLERLAKPVPSLGGDQTPVPQHADAAGGGAPSDPVSSATLYPRLEQFLQPGHIVVSDCGSCGSAMVNLRLPQGAVFFHQMLWGSIGWSTPAAFGAAVADPSRPVLLVTGDGGHQLTANEIGAMGRYGVKPTIIVLNNGEYGIEETLSSTVMGNHEYNMLPAWRYADIPHAMGCDDWYTARVSTLGDLDAALATAATNECASYIEVVLPPEDITPRLPVAALNRIYDIVLPS